MGEYAEMMLDGTCCAGCGEFLDQGSAGHPVYCSTCSHDEEKVQQPIPQKIASKRARKKRQQIRRSQRRRYALENADTTGWQQLSDFHFRRTFGTVVLDWYPSTGAYTVKNKRISVDDAQKIINQVSR